MQPYYERDGITIYNADCLEILPDLESDSVDLVLTDPPYNVGKPYADHNDRMGSAEYIEWLQSIFRWCGDVSRDGLVFTPGNRNLFDVPAMLSSTPFHPVRVLGWHRKEFAGDKANGGPPCSWEAVVWASKQPKPFYNRFFGTYGRDFLVVPSVRNNPYSVHHPCPKPNKVIAWLVGLFAPAEGVILDPFAGTGTTLQVALELGRKAIGIEISREYCDLAIERLRQGVLPLEVPV